MIFNKNSTEKTAMESEFQYLVWQRSMGNKGSAIDDHGQ